MNKEEQQVYLEQYHLEKEKGVPFFPDILLKDAIVSLLLFIGLIALAYFVRAPLEERANPVDASYTPRPEWYFLFLFQLLKYFPGNYEAIGVVLLPTLVVLLLFFLPLIDRGPERRPARRFAVNGIAGAGMVGIAVLTILAVREAPPPSASLKGDQTAVLYTKNCSGCHGTSIQVKNGTDLHKIIAQGKHEGMPAWVGDLTSDQIDALAGFILSPGGSQLFTDNCGSCHKINDLVGGNPINLKNSLEMGKTFPAHQGVNVPDWGTTLNDESRTSLLNFLIAPDGKRLFETECSPCHGKTVAFSGSSDDLRKLISQGGKHLDMPAWKGKLPTDQLAILEKYVYAPAQNPDGQKLFQEYCSGCHGQKVPVVASVEAGQKAIESGGAHRSMPLWGQVLTGQQLDALVSYTLQSDSDTKIENGQKLFSQYCTPCHGEFGEGGPNPARSGDIIPPISTKEFLKTRDDITLNAIISQGQPNFGMSPFGSSNGGSLNSDQIDAIVSYIRSWEAHPPVDLPPEAASFAVIASPDKLYGGLCAQCHGDKGQGGVGPEFQSAKFQAGLTDEDIANAIKKGHPSTPMIRWGDILSAKQVVQLVATIRSFAKYAPVVEATPTTVLTTTTVLTPTTSLTTTTVLTPTAVLTTTAGVPSKTPTFKDIAAVLEANCQGCHGSLGGWDASTYQTVMTSGDHAPVIMPGDPQRSLLMQKLLNTQKVGNQMPPGDQLSQDLLDLISTWIKTGAKQ